VAARDENLNDLVDTEERGQVVRFLFYGRKDIRENPDPIEIGPMVANGQKHEALRLMIEWRKAEVNEEGRREWRSLRPDEAYVDDEIAPYITVDFNEQVVSAYSLLALDRFDKEFRRYAQRSEIKTIRCISVTTSGIARLEIGRLWDNITLTTLAQDVTTALKIIAPDIEGANLIGDKEPTSARITRIPIVKLKNADRPIPLRNLGDGMNRLFGIFLALVNAKDGMLLVDEIENGLHYSIQPDIWRLVFQVASQLNVQVFATTHSYDTIQAFMAAAQENLDQEGILIRLQKNSQGDIVSVPFDEEELEIATSGDIEVR